MRPNWWAACVHLMLVLVIALEIGWLVFACLFLIPKFQKLAMDGVIDLVSMAEEGHSWMPALLDAVYYSARYVGWIALAAAILVVLFEWRVKSQNKAFIRLSALATVALGLTVVSVLVGASLALPQLLCGPLTSRMAVTFAVVQVDHIEASLGAMEKALLNKDWEAMKEPAARASQALHNLDKARPAVHMLWTREGPTEEEMRARVKEAKDIMTDIRQAIDSNDAGRMPAALTKLRESYAPLREAAKSAR